MLRYDCALHRGSTSSAMNASAAFIHQPKSVYNSGNGINLADWSPAIQRGDTENTLQFL